MADDMKKITEDIIVSHDLRVKVLGDLFSDAHQTMKDFEADRKKMAKEVDSLRKGFQKEHKEMADALREDLKKGETDRLNAFKDLKEDLEKGETDRLNAFKDMMENIQKCIKDIETYTADKLKEFSDARTDMSEELKKELVKANRNLLKGYADERERMAAEWQKMVVTIAGKKVSGPKPVERIVKKKAEKAEIKTAEEVTEETRSLEERILEIISEHPEGMRVGEMEEPLETPRMKLGVITKKLLDEGKVRKEDQFYFPL